MLRKPPVSTALVNPRTVGISAIGSQCTMFAISSGSSPDHCRCRTTTLHAICCARSSPTSCAHAAAERTSAAQTMITCSQTCGISPGAASKTAPCGCNAAAWKMASRRAGLRVATCACALRDAASTPRFPCRGTARCRSVAFTAPLPAARSGHLAPGSSSMPARRSSPPE